MLQNTASDQGSSLFDNHTVSILVDESTGNETDLFKIKVKYGKGVRSPIHIYVRQTESLEAKISQCNTKPIKWHVRQAKTKINLGIRSI